MSHHATTTHADSKGHDDHGHGHHGTGIYWIVFFALMFLMFATVAVAYFHLGAFNVPVAYGIATLKAILILWFFMHLSESSRLIQVFAFSSFAWLLICLIMVSGDYLSRGKSMLPRADPLTEIRKVDSYDVQSGGLKNRWPGTKEDATHGSAASPAAGHSTATPVDGPATKPAH
jgi:cytochrome c oxidase subunit IV